MRVGEVLRDVIRNYNLPYIESRHVVENYFPDVKDFISIITTSSSREEGVYGRNTDKKGNRFYSDNCTITVSNSDFKTANTNAYMIRNIMDGAWWFGDGGVIHDEDLSYRIVYMRVTNGPNYIGLIEGNKTPESQRFTINVEVGYEYT